MTVYSKEYLTDKDLGSNEKNNLKSSYTGTAPNQVIDDFSLS